jgi:lipooligosaccharide transport system permease protein
VFVLVGGLFGAWASWWVVAAVPVVVLTGMAFSVPCFALSAMLRDNVELGYTVLFRFVMTPLFLFSGTFFPVDQLPAVLQPVAWVTPLWHGVEVSRDLALGAPDWGAVALHTAYLVLLVALSSVWALRAFRRRLVV